MAQFTPSKKTIKDFNDGEEYLNRIDVVQANTVNNLVEGLLYAQENGGGITELDKEHLDSMWNIWSADGSDDTLVNKVEEVLSAFNSFKEGDTIIDLLSKKADADKVVNSVNGLTGDVVLTGHEFALADVAFSGKYDDLKGTPDLSLYAQTTTLSNYVTLNKNQVIAGQKSFSNPIHVLSNGIESTLSADSISVGKRTDGTLTNPPFVRVEVDGIHYLYATAIGREQEVFTFSYPTASGILALRSDIKTYTAGTGISISSTNGISSVAASSTVSGHVNTTTQTFAGRKTFNGGINIPSGATIQLSGSSGTEGKVLTSHGTSKVPSWENNVNSVNGLTGDVVLTGHEFALADVAFSGKYDDLKGKPASVVTSVNNQTGAITITKETLGLGNVTNNLQFPYYTRRTGANFNDIKTNGAYVIEGTASSACSNMPTSSSNPSGSNCFWFLLVFDNTVSGVTNIVTQVAISARTDREIYIRNYSSATWSAWKNAAESQSSLLSHFPIGALYISYVSTSPASLFGGSWTQIMGYFPYFTSGNGTGGSNTHTLTTAELPAHRHGLYATDQSFSDTTYMEQRAIKFGQNGALNTFIWSNGNQTKTAIFENSTSNIGSGNSFSIMPHYQGLFAWRRTA